MRILFRSLIISLSVLFFFALLYLPKWSWLYFDPNTISLFTWGDIIDPKVIADFERESGIKVRINYYSSNEELMVKLKSTRTEGYDLIIPSDYAVKALQEEGLLQPIDHNRLSFYKDLDPRLLSHPFDPQNHFSIPFSWEIYGLGVDNSSLTITRPSWDLLFDPNTMHYKITMLNDPIEAVQLAAFYLFGNIERTISPQEKQAVKELLIRQKPFVEAYSEFRGDYFLATGNCPLVIATSSYIANTIKRFPYASFLIPEEGTYIAIENLALPIKTTKQDQVYALINYLYRAESISSHFQTYHFFPAIQNAYNYLQVEPQLQGLVDVARSFKREKLHFTRKLLPDQELRDLWIEVKATQID